jgi:ApaG protein
MSSTAVTEGIRVTMTPHYVPSRSDPDERQYFFAYTVVIANEGDAAARLVSRHWIISDGHGSIEEVQGPGVVGQTPRLEPGETFEYTSACPLPTPRGTMHGTYQMVRDDGRRFDAEIAPCLLVAPGHEPDRYLN